MNENELYQCPYEKACKCRMDEPCNGCETWAEALRKKTEPVAKLQCSDGLDGPFMKAWACVDCGTLLTWSEKMDSLGTCPYCGHTVTGTVVETDDHPQQKQIKEKKRAIQWRNETPEQKAFGYGMIAGFLACMGGALMGMLTHG